MISELPRSALYRAAERRQRGGWLALTCANRGYLGAVLNWLVAMRRARVDNTLTVALDAETSSFLRARGFDAVLAPCENELPAIRTTRLQVTRFLIEQEFSVIQSDADAVWLQDVRPHFERAPQSIVATQGTYWPAKAYAQWGFVLCTGLYSIRSNAATKVFLNRWLEHLGHSGSDQRSFNELLVDEGVDWRIPEGAARLARFRDKDFRTFDSAIPGVCAASDLELSLLPHDLFQRVPVAADALYVAHHLPDLAKLPETRALTGATTWFLSENWQQTEFDAESLERITVSRDALTHPSEWQPPTVQRPAAKKVRSTRYATPTVGNGGSR